MLALELLQYIKGNMKGVGTVSVPFHISQINKAITELIVLQAENEKLKIAMETIDTIARNTTKLTSPLYPTTIKMIRQKIKQVLKGE